MKKIILPLMIILLTSLVQGSICEERVIPGNSCEMISPLLNCIVYNYSIYNLTQEVDNGSLTLIKDGIYYFDFNKSEGDYIVKYCDNSTKQIIVSASGGNNMSAILVLPLYLLIFALIYFMFQLDKIHFAFKIGLWFLVFALIPAALGQTARIANILLGSSGSAVVGLYEKLWGFSVVFFYIVLFYWFCAFIYWIVHEFYMKPAKEKDEEFNESFGNLEKW